MEAEGEDEIRREIGEKEARARSLAAGHNSQILSLESQKVGLLLLMQGKDEKFKVTGKNLQIC